MTQNIKTIITALALSIALLSTNISASAQTIEYSKWDYIVNAPTGLNLRDTNCNVIEVLPHKTYIQYTYSTDGYSKDISPFGEEPLTKTCTVNGTTYDMRLITSEVGEISFPTGYIATEFLSKVRTRTFSDERYDEHYDFTNRFKADASIGLNVRDRKCGKVGAVPNNYSFEENFPAIGYAPIVCEAKGEFYRMRPFMYQQEIVWVAIAFIK